MQAAAREQDPRGARNARCAPRQATPQHPGRRAGAAARGDPRRLGRLGGGRASLLPRRARHAQHRLGDRRVHDRHRHARAAAAVAPARVGHVDVLPHRARGHAAGALDGPQHRAVRVRPGFLCAHA